MRTSTTVAVVLMTLPVASCALIGQKDLELDLTH